MAGILDWLAGLGNMLGAATYTRPQDIQAVRGLLPQSVDNALAGTFQSPTANDALGVLGGPTLGAIRAFHGSPYDFDRFDLSKIGTGEGAQAYGHGLYFAENPEVAGMYRDSLGSKQPLEYQGKPINSPDLPYGTRNALQWLENNQKIGDTPETLINRRVQQLSDHADFMRNSSDISNRNSAPMYDNAVQALKAIDPSQLKIPTGRMYEVNINAEPQQFLDWDKPLNQQPQEVLNATNPFLWNEPRSKPMTGEDIYRTVAGASAMRREPGWQNIAPNLNRSAAASDVLRQAGIPGIKYLDQGSRTAGQGTNNYVVFNPGLIDIIRKYGIAAGVSPLAAYAAAQQNQQ